MPRFFLIFSIALLLAACSGAPPRDYNLDNPGAQVRSLRAEYAGQMAEVERERDEALEEVRLDQIEKLRERKTRKMEAGELEPTSLVQAEIELLEGYAQPEPEPEPDDAFKKLNRMRADYLTEREKVKAEYEDKAGEVREGFIEELEAYQQALVQAGRLERARAVADYSEGAALLLSEDQLRYMRPVRECQMIERKDWYELSSIHYDRSFMKTEGRLAPPLRIRCQAQTDGKDISLYWGSVGRVIFNWGKDRNQLRVHDPKTGRKQGIDGKGFVEPLEWHDFVWEIRPGEMVILVDGEERHRQEGDFAGLLGSPGIGPGYGSRVLVRDFIIEPLN